MPHRQQSLKIPPFPLRFAFHSTICSWIAARSSKAGCRSWPWSCLRVSLLPRRRFNIGGQEDASTGTDSRHPVSSAPFAHVVLFLSDAPIFTLTSLQPARAEISMAGRTAAPLPPTEGVTVELRIFRNGAAATSGLTLSMPSDSWSAFTASLSSTVRCDGLR